MTDPTPLSPAAQAVSNAAKSSLDWEAGYLPNAVAAAALCAAADQVVPEDDSMPLNLAHRVRWDAQQSLRRRFLAIAAELEGQ